MRCRVPANLAKDSVSSQDCQEAVKAGKGTQAEGVGVGGWIGGGERGCAEPVSKRCHKTQMMAFGSRWWRHRIIWTLGRVSERKGWVSLCHPTAQRPQ